MARKDRHSATDLIGWAERERGRVGFFQIVRLLSRMAKRPPAVGGDARLAEEPVRFRAGAGMRRPATELLSASMREADHKAELTVSFMGLTGPSGVLPDHYTELVVQRRRARDPGLIEFLDLFNHRVISLFYRAWAKYRLPVRFEEAPRRLDDPHSRALAALIGLGLNAQQKALAAGDGELLSMAGPLSRKVRSAGALRRVLAALFEFPVQICELEGRWIVMSPGEQTRLGARGQFSQLGVDAVVGANVWDVQSRFRVRFGPMGLTDFRSFFVPDGPRRAIDQAIRLSVGPGMDYDLQLVLRRAEAPPLVLGSEQIPALLGQSTWLISQTPDRDLEDATLPSGPGPSQHAEAAPKVAAA